MNKHIGLLLICLFSIGLLYSQGASSGASIGNTAAFSYSGTMNEADQLKILTYIWGQISRPGLYIVPDDTDLLTLMSLAGGPTVDAKLTTIRIVRSSAFGDEEIITVDMKKYLETGDHEMIPRLMPGDAVIVQGTSFYAFSRVVSFLANVAIVISTYVAVRNLF